MKHHPHPPTGLKDRTKIKLKGRDKKNPPYRGPDGGLLPFNPNYELGFVARFEIAKKSSCLET
jgi:hypothetical protein